MRKAASKVLPKSKTRDTLATWLEFNQLARKYDAFNFTQGIPGLMPPKFLIENMQNVIADGPLNHYTLVDGHAELRASIAQNF